MKIVVKKLAELSSEEWCDLVAERIKVFVVEQHCPYQEVDQDDYHAYHLVLKDDQNNLVGYTRIYQRNDGKVTFGRVLVPKEYRKNHYGHQLIQATIDEAHKLFPHEDIQIQAQAYLENFYHSFGFQPISKVYLEDNIPHLDMLLKGAN